MQSVLDFWFDKLDSADWFRKSTELDRKIKNQFEETHRQVTVGETADWRNVPKGRLAEILVLDQFSRNMFRDTSAAFASDPLALALAQEAVRVGDDQKLEESQRIFLYMPYMHSESAKIHEHAIVLFEDTSSFEFELKHKVIIDRFGRYPHRNSILGRTSTAEEIAWMEGNQGF